MATMGEVLQSAIRNLAETQPAMPWDSLCNHLKQENFAGSVLLELKDRILEVYEQAVHRNIQQIINKPLPLSPPGSQLGSSGSSSQSGAGNSPRSMNHLRSSFGSDGQVSSLPNPVHWPSILNDHMLIVCPYRYALYRLRRIFRYT
jgi:hypothetical protein